MCIRDRLEALGYARASATDAPSPGTAELAGIHVREWALRAAVEARSLRRDANHWRRWGRAATLRVLGVRRRVAHGVAHGVTHGVTL